MQKPLSDLYAALCARAQEPAPEGARALYIAGRRCGWATHAACDALRDAPETQSNGTALRIGEGLAPGNALDAALEQAAELLGVSRATADRHWAFARAWLFDAMTRGQESP